MRRAPNIAVIYYSRRGTVHALAQAAAAGAGTGGAHVRLLRVPGDPQGGERADLHGIPVATPEDLRWADGVVLGTPTYYGNISSPLKRFIESASALWREGALADRVVTAITTSNSLHGGRETTLLALYQSMYHWGALILSAGTTDEAFTAAGANPYGVCAPSDQEGAVGAAPLWAAQTLGVRVSRAAARMAAGRDDPPAGSPGRIAVICDPREGATRALAAALAEGAMAAGAEVRLLPVGASRHWGSRGATPADVEWADAVAMGAHARIGTVSPLLLQFIEECEPLRASGRLDGKAATGFVTTSHPHSGSESALLAFYNAMHHWGAVIVPPGYTDPSITTAGGNPYGISHTAADGPLPSRETLAAAVFQGGRLARVTTQLRGPTRPAAAAPARPADAQAAR
ncbi:flavodoxin family protein [Streptomyces sp. IBSBF 2435]|uniref:flavodoxin family protein n=1 Tax=Streptomyces sp. IBSBF 2435 TaxID=2903531 RepID=UPI002FDBE0BD